MLHYLQTLEGQLRVAFSFAVLWSISIEVARRKIATWVSKAPWWPCARPNQISVMENFGYTKGEVTEEHAIYGFVWVITMCITHVVSASLMLPVVLLGWKGAGETGQACFLLGTLSEVGFDIYDGVKVVLLTFCPSPFPFLGPKNPIKTFILIGVFHHATVLSMTIPMNLNYPTLTAYHWVAFSLLFSAGVCYLSGQYKFTLNGKTAQGLQTIKQIMALQFVMNWGARCFLWFPCVYTTLSTFYVVGDMGFFRGACMGALGMSLYNILVVLDATAAFLKWWGQSANEAKKE